MTSRLLVSLSLLLSAWQNAGAQLAPAADFFNSGAQFYISNNIPQALESTEAGLKQYPNDEKLKKLEQLLKQQQQQNSHDQQKQNKQKQNQADQKKDEQQRQAEQQKSSADKKDGEKPDTQDAAGQPVKAGEMTPEEAKRLLDAQKGDEQILQWKLPGKPEDQNRPVKDW